MEDVARLAVIEQTIGDVDKYNMVLHDLLLQIDYILKDPHDFEVRTLRSAYLKKAMEHEVFCDYLKYIGFQLIEGEFIYPKEQTLGKLRMAQAAIKRKICICYGSNASISITKPASSLVKSNKPKLKSVYLPTQNEFLKKIQTLFNDVLKYEDGELQALAQKHIPLVTLQLKAIERVREHQQKLKSGELKGDDLSYEIALLMELLGWFKYKFFSWVDKPDCEECGGPTVLHKNGIMNTGTETCRVEIYKCTRCPTGGARFARYNDVATLLRTRRGRCGEWANCFALLCRAIGYDTRYVYDTTDHVWCEVFDHGSKSWLHADPCECLLDAPLTYSRGWGKRISYVIAASSDDLQDVTWRYTSDHREVLKRRTLCEESELINGLVALRAQRQAQVSEARRRYLVKRGLKELVQLMVERKPGDYETRGRISGSTEWRKERGEIGKEKTRHTFQFTQPGNYTMGYYTGPDKYRVKRDGAEMESMDSFAKGTYECVNIFRKVEKDWRQVYLAREEGEAEGSISWRIETNRDGLTFDQLTVELTTALYENGKIECTLQFDGETPQEMKLGEKWQFQRKYKQAVLSCRLSGGKGDVAWQHAQLFRQSLDSDSCGLQLTARLTQNL